MVRSYFADACPALADYGYNPVLYANQKIKAGQTWEAYYFFLGIKGVGGKLAAFFLRDITDVYGLRGELNPGDLPFVFPVDRWVKRVVNILWGELVSQATNTGQPEKYEKSQQKEMQWVVYVAVTECCKYNIHPIDFDRGAWYLGYTSGTWERLEEALNRACP